MLQVNDLTKHYGDILAVDNISVALPEGQVFGLLGTNGSGKSTLLRLIAGILMPESGEILSDGRPIFEDPEAKRSFFYISDDQYFFANATPEDMANYWRLQYPKFDMAAFDKMLDNFALDKKRRIRTFSKGMQKQTALFCAIAANTRYMLCDETFDGLDPVVRQAVKSLFADQMAERGFSPIIASHSLRELEDICDGIGLLHRGKLLLSRQLDDMKQNVHKVQAAFDRVYTAADFPQLDVVSIKQSGHLLTLVIRGDEQQVQQAVAARQPLFMEMLPLTLEEVFISETEVAGYAFKQLML